MCFEVYGSVKRKVQGMKSLFLLSAKWTKNWVKIFTRKKKTFWLFHKNPFSKQIQSTGRHVCHHMISKILVWYVKSRRKIWRFSCLIIYLLIRQQKQNFCCCLLCVRETERENLIHNSREWEGYQMKRAKSSSWNNWEWVVWFWY